LLGGALGDALGYPIEFSRDAFPDAAPAFEGIVSDDTQMTMFTAEGLVDTWNAPVLERVHEAYQRWLRTQASAPERGLEGLLGVPELWVRRAPGNTCLTALMQNAHFDRMPSVVAPPNDSKGCGAVMRSAPFGLWCKTRTEAFTLARDAGVLTHGHPSGYLSAAVFASLVFDLARGVSFEAALNAAIALLVAERGHEETLAAITAARAIDRTPDRATLEALGGGWVGEEALAIAIACARTATDVRAALWRSVAHAGDSDSTGSLTGNLLGAMHGTSALPEDWLAALEMREAITKLADSLSE
jgi:ADP-ribosylglycohydrolase